MVYVGVDLHRKRSHVVALVPAVEHLGQLGGAEPEALAEQVVGLGDELHVGVLDAVVDHLDAMKERASAPVLRA